MDRTPAGLIKDPWLPLTLDGSKGSGGLGKTYRAAEGASGGNDERRMGTASKAPEPE